MTRRKTSPSATAAERVEHAIVCSGGRLRLWLVFESADDVQAARELLKARKVRHVEALSCIEWARREETAYRRITGLGDAAVSSLRQAVAK